MNDRLYIRDLVPEAQDTTHLRVITSNQRKETITDLHRNKTLRQDTTIDDKIEIDRTTRITVNRTITEATGQVVIN